MIVTEAAVEVVARRCAEVRKQLDEAREAWIADTNNIAKERAYQEATGAASMAAYVEGALGIES